METFTLIPWLPNPVVECHDINLPNTTQEFVFKESVIYDKTDTNGAGKRILCRDIEHNVDLYFRTLVYNKIAPLFFEHPKYQWSWPITLQNFIESTNVNVTVVKDSVGWSQPLHEDPRIYPASGIIHLQDCEQGTHFQSENYVAPCKKYSGAFWANNQWSHHWVPTVTSERVAYLVIVQWKFLYGMGISASGKQTIT
jgi:hypothetical protein